MLAPGSGASLLAASRCPDGSRLAGIWCLVRRKGRVAGWGRCLLQNPGGINPFAQQGPYGQPLGRDLLSDNFVFWLGMMTIVVKPVFMFWSSILETAFH